MRKLPYGRATAIAAIALALHLGLAGDRRALGFHENRFGPLATRPDLTAQSLQALEVEVHDLVNAYRRSQNLPPLALSQEMGAVARRHSREMAAGRTSFSHQGFETRARELRGTFNYRYIAENLASNRGFARPAMRAFEGWLGSPGHQKNILGAFNRTGIGIARAEDGTYYFTQLFLQEP